MKLLVKIPSFGRPDKLKAVLRAAQANQWGKVEYIISLDLDDPTVTGELLKELGELGTVSVGVSNNKIDACNRDIPKNGWDIVVLLSDDMYCIKEGWDEEIKEQMEDNYPDTDGCLWFNDGYTDKRLYTLPILGRKYYKRFNYIYHPDYISLWCDNEMMEVGKQLERISYFPEILFRHEHPANNSEILADNLYNKNESYYHLDGATYERRKGTNYGLSVKG